MPKRKRLLTSLGLFLGRQPEANFGRFRFGRTRTNGLGRFFRGHLGPFDFGSDAVSVCAIAKCRLQTVGLLVTVAYPGSILFGLCSRRAHLVAIVTVTHERLSTTICVVRKRIYVTSGIRKGSFPGCLSGIRGYGAAGAHAGVGSGGSCGNASPEELARRLPPFAPWRGAAIGWGAFLGDDGPLGS